MSILFLTISVVFSVFLLIITINLSSLGIDIVMSHVPPHGHLDQNEEGAHWGSQELLQCINSTKPRYVFFCDTATANFIYLVSFLCCKKICLLLKQTKKLFQLFCILCVFFCLHFASLFTFVFVVLCYRYCVFGHIHESYGVEEVRGEGEEGITTTFINAASVNKEFQPVNKPHVCMHTKNSNEPETENK